MYQQPQSERDTVSIRALFSCCAYLMCFSWLRDLLALASLQ